MRLTGSAGMTSAGAAALEVLRPDLVRFAARLVGDAEAEDVVQAALLKASAGLGGFRGESSLRSWIFSITSRAALDLLRSRRVSVLLDSCLDGDPEPEEEPPVDSDQERAYLREEMAACVEGILRRLPERHRVVLILSESRDLADREIADLLGVSLGAAKIRLHRARTAMRQALETDCAFYRDDRDVLCCDRKEALVFPRALATRKVP